MKRLFYLSGAVCFLTATVLMGQHILTGTGTAAPTTGGFQIVEAVDFDEIRVLTASGERWTFHSSWVQDDTGPLPVPADQIVGWAGNVLVTADGEGYYWGPSDGWQARGYIPGTEPVTLKPITWGNLKQRFGG